MVHSLPTATTVITTSTFLFSFYLLQRKVIGSIDTRMRSIITFAISLLLLHQVSCFFLTASLGQNYNRKVANQSRIAASSHRPALHRDRPLLDKLSYRKKNRSTTIATTNEQRFQFNFEYLPPTSSSSFLLPFEDEQKVLYETNDEIEWNESYETLRNFYNEHDSNFPLPANLRKWSERQRQLLLLSVQKETGGLDEHRLRRSTESLAFLSLKQIAKLRKLGGSWEMYSEPLRWEDWYRTMVKYYSEYGDVHIVGEECLAQWVQLQRTLESLGLLHPYQVHLMWAVNFCWDTEEADFMIQYQKLLDIEKEPARILNQSTISTAKRKKMKLTSSIQDLTKSKTTSVRSWKKLQQFKKRRERTPSLIRAISP